LVYLELILEFADAFRPNIITQGRIASNTLTVQITVISLIIEFVNKSHFNTHYIVNIACDLQNG